MKSLIFRDLNERINFLESELSKKLVFVAQEHHRRANPNPDNILSTRFHYFQCLLYAHNNYDRSHSRMIEVVQNKETS